MPPLMKAGALWHPLEGSSRLAQLEREAWIRHRPGAIAGLRRARALVEGGSRVRAALLTIDPRDPYGAMAIASVVLERAAVPRTFDLDEWSAGRTKAEVLALFDRAISALESTDGTFAAIDAALEAEALP